MSGLVFSTHIFCPHAPEIKEKPQTNSRLSSFTPWPLLKLMTPSFMFAAASAIRGYHEVTCGSALIRILKWRSSARGKGYWEFKESALSNGEYQIKGKSGLRNCTAFSKVQCRQKAVCSPTGLYIETQSRGTLAWTRLHLCKPHAMGRFCKETITKQTNFLDLPWEWRTCIDYKMRSILDSK